MIESEVPGRGKALSESQKVCQALRHNSSPDASHLRPNSNANLTTSSPTQDNDNICIFLLSNPSPTPVVCSG